jgi:UDP-GlcNAc:undecaprenyl-phosphate GlcNAc-1-phosphate transferase
VAGVLIASSLVAAVGLIDDRLGLPAWAKLLGQFLGFVVLLIFGIGVQLPVPQAVNYAITFLWLAGISNAVNFLDNMDGLSAGVSAVAAAFLLLLATVNSQFLVAALSAALLGACLGFLRYNFQPARIYMGDAGSLFLGFLLAVLAMQLRFPDNSNFVTWMVPVFILGVPIFDMALVVFSRLRRGVKPTTPGRDHTSHRLVNRGFTVRESVLVLYLVGGILGLIALFITQATIAEGYVIGLFSAVLAALAIWRLDGDHK